jgi:hypothetical protein
MVRAEFYSAVVLVTLVSCSDDAATTGSGDGTSQGSGASGSSSTSAASMNASSSTGIDETLTAEERSLVDMPADSWLEIDTGYMSVCDSPEGSDWHAVSGCGGLFSWSGGAFDHASRQMLLFGGGHDDYAGNEVFAFSTKTLTWARLTEPSLKPYDRDPLDDGKPVSRHTYDGLTWDDDSALMFAWGGARSNDGSATRVLWSFDPVTTTWTNYDTALVPNGSYDSSLVYDKVTKRAYLKVTEKLYYLDVQAKNFVEAADLGLPPLWPRYAGGNNRGTIDTKRRLFWVIGGGMYMIYDIDQAKFVTDDWITTGGGDFTNADAVSGHPEQVIQTGGGDVLSVAAPGLDYDSKADQMVAWVGGAPYVLDLSTKVWTRKSGVGAPGMPASTGTYGRLRYIPRYNVFILVNGGDEVFFYKNSAGGP